MNAAAALCSHDLLFVSDDDDLYLPHRLSLSASRLDPKRGFFKASTALFLNDGVLSGPEHTTFHGGSIWTRDLFVASRGYPHLTDGVDQAIERCFAMARLDAVQAAEWTARGFRGPG